MRILLSNKFYYNRGGDCAYMLNLEQLLKEKGHDVAIFAMDYPDNLPTVWNKYFPSEIKFSFGQNMFEAFKRPLGSKEVKRKFRALLDDFKPDVVHLNNIHSYLSPVIAQLAHERGIRVVWTLHDYKLICPSYSCLRNGKTCELCFKNKSYVLWTKCMKNSLLVSLFGYLEAFKWNKSRLENDVDAFICPSKFMEEKMIGNGFHKEKMHYLCNFIDPNKTNLLRKNDNATREKAYCYVGRLSEEKGLRTLLEVASHLPYPLYVAGTGPLGEELKATYQECRQIIFLGKLNAQDVISLFHRVLFSVIPSECYENNPLSGIESLCAGTPILGAAIGGIPELINQSNGMLFISKNAINLKENIIKMFDGRSFSYKEISEAAQCQFSADSYYNLLLKLYYEK